MAFCFSCGAPLTAGAQEPDPAHPGPTPSEEPSPLDKLMTWLRQAADRLRRSFSGVSTDGARRLPGRAVGWFRDLSSIPKLIIVGLVLLVLLILLSPVAAIICALLLGVSIIALIIRVVQRRSVKNWAIVAVASVVLVLTFGATSDALYGSGFLGSSGSDSGRGGGGGAPPGQDGGGEKRIDSPSAGGGGASPSPSPSSLAVGDEVSFTARPWGTAEEVSLDGRPFMAVVFEISSGEHIQVVSSIYSEDSSDTYTTLIALGSIAQSSEAATVNIDGVYLGPYVRPAHPTRLSKRTRSLRTPARPSKQWQMKNIRSTVPGAAASCRPGTASAGCAGRG
jgi:hypothetical protein